MKRGYVLHHRPYRESSVIVNLIIDGVGRVDAITRLGNGKRSIKSIVQPFQPLIIQFSAQSEAKNLSLKTVTHIEPASPPIPLTGNSLYSGFYLNELLVRLLSVDHQADSLFLAYHRALMSLAESFCSSHLRYFEKALLLELGALPSLQYDCDGNTIEALNFYRLVADSGFIPVLQQSIGHFSHGKSVVPGAMLIQLHQHDLQAEYLNSAKGLMRFLLKPLLGSKPLLSRQLFVK
ncbi:DNA repair protein RecO [Shewanella aestuarii]|uniref:DNA repair protein RecO n=1 Tax=Shewanella aestuarii TaxID=1028752 RepID=A0A6G9QNR1_9GAMM|nr:recombination protein O N-terminal domain-containing protein [Shewanella aestuarii]QIR16224.1 DNA repair protein RecO [Shewanella aestuarii]